MVIILTIVVLCVIWLAWKVLKIVALPLIGIFLFITCFGELNRNGINDWTAFGLAVILVLIARGIYKTLKPVPAPVHVWTAEQLRLMQQLHDSL